jgi:hypothetical protein
MKEGFRGLAGKSGSKATAILVLALLLFPSSYSVLCIAPGNHVAIEDINALCCVSSTISSLRGNQPHSGIEDPGSCNNCTDIFLASNENGALLQSGKFVTPAQVDAECPDKRLSASIFASLWRSGSIERTDLPIPASTSVPLRC